jgi:pimeloyl-ACP methyl ester carboxylesterase
MNILRFSRIGLAALMVFSVCKQSSADSTDYFSQAVQGLPFACVVRTPSEQCPFANVITCDLPIYWDRPGLQTFPYSFQIQPATEPSPEPIPIGIVINGGAGAPSIGKGPGAVFPPTFHVIYTDVRGVGCNIGDPEHPYPTDMFTTEYFSRDVLAVVRFLLLTDYFLFGVSYGTVQATVMANIAWNEGIQTPRALILEGILGLWSINAQEVVDYNYQWNHAKTLLPASVVSSFETEENPYGIPASDWMTLLAQTLNDGFFPERNGNSTVYYLYRLGNPLTRPGAIARINQKIAEIEAGYKPETARLARILHCTETAGSIYKKALVNGQIVNTGPDLCPPNVFVRPYDSRDYPVNVPIYYFEGSRDPNTSPANADHHFDYQTQTTRAFTTVLGGGHTDLSDALRQLGCRPAIFTAIARNPLGLADALRQCNWYLEFKYKGVGQ